MVTMSHANVVNVYLSNLSTADSLLDYLQLAGGLVGVSSWYQVLLKVVIF